MFAFPLKGWDGSGRHEGRLDLSTLRRNWIGACAALGLAAVFAALPGVAGANEEPEWRHATALTGEPKYPANFKHFDYVNPDAPKGGRVRLASPGSFDTLNIFLPKGDPAPGVQLVYESLTTPSLDELDISAAYGLIADALKYPPDYSWVSYRLNPAAKWQDGQPITPDDVIWSFETLREINPQIAGYYTHVTKVEAAGEREVKFTFDQAGNRELPHIVGQLEILPKHWWEGTDANGKQRNIRETTLELPMGSGPYKVKSVDPGRSVVLERDPNYWGANLPAQIGQNNFDLIQYESYLDQTVLLEAFKADRFDFRAENSAKNWATGYDFPAKNQGKVILETYPDKASGVMQAMVPNLRREKFQDPRVRRALNLAFDYESLNRTVFFGQYKRVSSYFENTDLAARGLPSPDELAILEPLKDKIPPDVFTKPYENPVGGSPEKQRENLREAVRLFKEAGWTLQNGKMINGKGGPFTIEFLSQSPNDERFVSPYGQALKRIGIDLTIRVVDSAQYVNRFRSFDFDLVMTVWGQSLSPGNEQRRYWGSKAADIEGSENYAGIKDPAVDALIERVIFAKNRADLVTAVKALDRVLLAHDYVIPAWTLDYDRFAYWNRFSRPEKLPEYSFGFPTVWWYDPTKAAAIGGGG